MPYPSEKDRTLLCFGDSLTETGSWVKGLESTGAWSTMNAGRSGRRLTEASDEFVHALDANPDATDLLIMIGVNDLCKRVAGTPAERLERLVEAVDSTIKVALKRFASDQIYLLAPPRVNPDTLSEVNHQKGYMDNVPLMPQLAEACQALGMTHQVNFMSALEAVSPANLMDGIHLNEAGNNELQEAIQASLTRPRLHLVGDSISIDYHEALATQLQGSIHYSRKAGLEQARTDLDLPKGANGGTSRQVLEYLRICKDAHSLHPEWIAFNCGLHDIRTDPDQGTRNIDPEAYANNLNRIIETIEDICARAIWINTTPVNDEQHNSHMAGFKRYSADAIAYNKVAEEIMDSRGVPVIDLNAFCLTLPEPLFRDHVHFSKSLFPMQAEFIAGEFNRIVFS